MQGNFFENLIKKNKKKFLFIGEISTNHRSDFNTAKKLISEAKKSKCDFVKFQTYENRSMTINSTDNFFKIQKGLWKNQSLWNLYSKGQTPFNWQKGLFSYAKKININAFSSPFDTEGIKVLENLKCPIYKIASLENTDFVLLNEIAKTKKPVIMSTGTADLKEIERSYSFLKKKGLRDISLLYCVTKYPAEPKDFNLNNIKLLKKKFNCTVGFSDHSNNNNVVKSAIAAGAEIIEKHIDIENKRNSLDSNFSIKSKELKNLIDELILIKKMFIKREYHLSDAEIKNRNQRRSIYVIKEISKNEKFGVKNLKSLRPYNGLASEIYFKLIGLRSHSKLKYGSKINLSTFRKILKYNKS